MCFMEYKRYTVIIIIIGILLLSSSFLFGTYWGYTKQIHAETIAVLFGNNKEDIPNDIDFTLLLKAWKLIDEKYPFEKPNNDERLWGAISGLVESIGDPYSSFFPPEEAKIFSGDIAGNFGGVGMEIGLSNGILTVISPLKNTPAEAVGLLPGDKIIKVGEKLTSQLSVNGAVNIIRGPIGTSVKLTIFREDSNLTGGGKTFDVLITRANIVIPTLETKINKDVYIISLFNFNSESTSLFSQALLAFSVSELDKLIIDLRGNPGGFLDAAINMASYFVTQGKVVVTENYGGVSEDILHRSKGYKIFEEVKKNPKIVVLVDGGSASASEIFAAALQEYGLATIVGKQTFGKGSVQELVPFTKNTFIKITVAKWLTPNGKSISDDGVTPDIIVERRSKDAPEEDLQMEEALRILNK